MPPLYTVQVKFEFKIKILGQNLVYDEDRRFLTLKTKKWHNNVLSRRFGKYSFYHFWPKNDGEKWSRKNICEIPPCPLKPLGNNASLQKKPSAYTKYQCFPINYCFSFLFRALFLVSKLEIMVIKETFKLHVSSWNFVSPWSDSSVRTLLKIKGALSIFASTQISTGFNCDKKCFRKNA